jgi:hypothetical protein
MRCRFALGFFCAFLLAAASPRVRVDEAGTKVVLREGQSAVSLAIENSLGREASAQIRLEWLDPDSKVLSSVERTLSARPGRSQLELAFPLPSSASLFTRLRYRLRAEDGESSGMLALTQIADHVFELRVSAPGLTQQKKLYTIRASTLHPSTGKPVPGVRLRGSLTLDEDAPLIVETVSDARGIATLEFQLPERMEIKDGELEVEGSLGDVRQAVEFGMGPLLARRVHMDISTDKPIYQPGQTLHIRVLCFGASWRAAAKFPIKLRIEDPERTRLFSTHLVTNRFGVAAADWQIPANTRLGDYWVWTETEGVGKGDDEDSLASSEVRTVKISRYDLPEFTVTAKPDRSYYLPGQNASVEVGADYLFGKPVPGAGVRVVRETHREWDYREQKWDIDEAEVYEGRTNEAGRFTTRLDLAKEHRELESDSHGRYEDLTFTAYVRDPSTGRTEERRFDVRVTRDPIHVYLWPLDSGFYVSTSYADGKPVACHVSVKGGASVNTNRYGLARITVPEEAELVELLAEDDKGGKGLQEERIWERPPSKLSVSTGKRLYRPGEPVEVEVSSSEPLPVVAVDVMREEELIESRLLDLTNKQARFELPWRAEFRREITISANVIGTDDSASRTVLFPARLDFEVAVRPGQPVYRPGEEATVALETRLAGGQTVETALGVAVADAAVGERARSDGVAGPDRVFSNLRSPDSEGISGVTLGDLYRLDCSEPFPEDLDLVAEAMLGEGNPYLFHSESSADYTSDSRPAFAKAFAAQLKPVIQALEERYKKDYDHPRDAATLKRDLAEAGIDFDSLRDPWGTPYRAEFKVDGPSDVLTLRSAGPDKQFGTDDDLKAAEVRRAHFQPWHDSIARTLGALPAYPQTEQDARAALLAAHIDPDQLCDPWGTNYRFEFKIENDKAALRFRSAGPDRVFGNDDDFLVGDFGGRYFSEAQRRLETALAAAKRFPQKDSEWTQLERTAGLYPLKDPWGRPVYAIFQQRSGFSDIRKPYSAAEYGNQPQTHTAIIPVTQTVLEVLVRSAGPDGVEGTKDDFELARFSKTINTETAPKSAGFVLRASGSRGAKTGWISGTIMDPAGAVIPRATAQAKRSGDAVAYEAKSDSNGAYLLGGLPPGFYELRITAPGFQELVVSSVPVRAGNATLVDATLQVGAAMETVTCSAEPLMLQTASAEVSQVVSGPRSTPRLREYFPETLLWQPLLETGADGRARINFKLADNITTWKIEAIGSTEEGDIGTASADIRAFQPFFIDHSPPRILTQGDEIDLPVTVRNYLEELQAVALSIKPESWFQLLAGDRRDLRVGAGTFENAVFPFRATAAVTDGKQRLTAISQAAGDAIEKPVSVHPDGSEIPVTLNAVFTSEAALDLAIPPAAIPGSASAELKIYPNLLAHVVESIEAILRRPYGCAEQAISSTYPSLLLLRYFKHTNQGNAPLRTLAQRYLRAGVDRLPGYATEDGGFSYWGHGDADVSLTAYALMFLSEAGDFTGVEAERLKRSREWLWKQQDALGRWPVRNWKKDVDESRTAYQTAFVALALAGPNPNAAIKRTLEYLSKRAGQFDEPYAIAATALTAGRSGDMALAANMRQRLRTLARNEAGMAYWNLETNTPFYGWGLAGRIETSALALRALLEGGEAADKALIDSGLLFLLRNQDRYGVWYSTQATVQVLGALLDATLRGGEAGAAGPAELRVNGVSVASVPVPDAHEIAPPVRFDLSPYLKPGRNQVTVRRAGASGSAQLQISAAYWTPWARSEPPADSPLRLSVAFDKTNGRAGDPVTCRVHAERVGFRGYGMMLAEIGLPPGTDVDRQSLDRAIESSGWGFNQYDILPDRVIAYLWPTGGGVDFTFSFRPRFAMRAKTASSLLYDYYNPDARVAVAPAAFNVAGTGTPTAQPARSAGPAPSPRNAGAGARRSAGP